MYVLTFVLGLTLLGLVTSDVSHLRQNQHYRGQQRFVPNNGEVVRQSFNQNSNRAYESAGKDARFKPIYTRPPAHNRVQRGCAGNGCASRSQNTRQITQQNTYNQNPFLNAKTHPSFNSFQSPIVTGSPSEVNNFLHQMIESGRQQQQSSSCADSTSSCVAPKFCFNGYIDQSVEHKAVRSSSGRCYAPEVCCRFSQRRSAPFNQDNTVSAAESRSEILTKEGYVVRKPSNQYLPGLPEFNQAPSNDQNTFLRPSTPAPRPYQPPRTQPPRIVPTQARPTPRPYQPPPPKPYQPQPTTQRPYQPQPTPQRPYQPQPTPQRPYQPQPTEIRPVPYDPAPVIVPVGCSAAMNCTNIQYCTASGMISKSPVTLTPQQETFRVPLTDCRKPDSQEVGKCCRDPDYTDPWPVGRTGQYVPEEINGAFDSGAYKPEPAPSGPLPVRVKPDGYVVPQPSNNQPRLYLPPNRI